MLENNAVSSRRHEEKISPSRLIIVGAAHIDESVRLQDALQPGESNRAVRHHSLGGVAANAVRAAHATCPKVLCSLIAALGKDLAGRSIAAHLTDLGVTSSFIYPEEATSSSAPTTTGCYTAILDQQGELVLGLASTDITEQITANMIMQTLPDKQPPRLLAFDTNLSGSCIAALCMQAKQQQNKNRTELAAIGVSPVKAMRLAAHGSAIDYLLVNRREATMLTGINSVGNSTASLHELSAALQQLNFAQHVITDGSRPLLVRDTTTCQLVTVNPIDQSVQTSQRLSVNGAGDALAGATLAGLSNDESLLESVTRFGLAAARRAMLSEVSLKAELKLINAH